MYKIDVYITGPSCEITTLQNTLHENHVHISCQCHASYFKSSLANELHASSPAIITITGNSIHTHDLFDETVRDLCIVCGVRHEGYKSKYLVPEEVGGWIISIYFLGPPICGGSRISGKKKGGCESRVLVKIPSHLGC